MSEIVVWLETLTGAGQIVLVGLLAIAVGYLLFDRKDARWSVTRAATSTPRRRPRERAAA